MSSVNFKRETVGSMESVILRVTEALKAQGFGVLTRFAHGHSLLNTSRRFHIG